MTATEQLAAATSALTNAVYALLPNIQEVIRHHPTYPAVAPGCNCRAGTWPCRDLDTAIAALDLVLNVHLTERSTAGFEPGTAADHRRPDAGPLVRGLERLRSEIASRRLSPDGSISLLTILASIDTLTLHPGQRSQRARDLHLRRASRLA